MRKNVKWMLNEMATIQEELEDLTPGTEEYKNKQIVYRAYLDMYLSIADKKKNNARMVSDILVELLKIGITAGVGIGLGMLTCYSEEFGGKIAKTKIMQVAGRFIPKVG